MTCAANCPAQALHVYGIWRSVGETLDLVEQDSLFYARSGGGLTLTGGEPLLQTEFTLALLREARRRRIHTAMESCGQASWEICQEACSLLDELLIDLKIIDSVKHKKFTGVENQLSLDNLLKIFQHFPKLRVCVRTPVVPGVNDNPEDIRAILEFLRPYPWVRYELLPYHRLGTQKYQFLDQDYPLGDAVLDKQRLNELTSLVATERTVKPFGCAC
jgi:pyruvate formate lyase activating enzyme